MRDCRPWSRSHLIGKTSVVALAAGTLLAVAPFLAAAAAASPQTSMLGAGARAVAVTAFPAAPPAQVCGVSALLSGPPVPPANAVVVPSGDNSTVNWNVPGATFWLAPGTHTLGDVMFGQIMPAANTTFLGGPGAVIDGRGVNRYAFTQTAVGVAIRYLTIQGFVPPLDEGVVNHDSGANWAIDHNTIAHNEGAGLMIGPGDIVRYNCLQSNGQYGFNAFKAGGDSNITIDHNEIASNNTGNWDVVRPGCGCVGGGKLWDTLGGSVTNNWIHNNLGPGIWADTNNAGILISGNYIADNDDEAIFYEISYNAQIINNTILRNGIVKGKAFAAAGSNFPVAAIYISESGGDGRVAGGRYATLAIAGNNLVDNWGGVTLWENADRFCGSPGNTSASYCTLVNPAATLSTCVAGTIDTQPYLSDCRWKTQNLSVHNNQMSFSRANVGCTGVIAGCGQEAIVSNYGTYPSWSPYMGSTVQAAMVSQQNNHFSNNTYVGDWQFVVGPTVVGFSAWRAAPNSMDVGSTLNGSTSGPPPVANVLDADTSTLEGSAGHWVPWFSTTVAQTTAQAQSGTHSLQVDVTAPYGWGVQLDNAPGFRATAGAQAIGFSARLGSGILGAVMTAQWRDVNGAVLATTTAKINRLTTTWQRATTPVTAPRATAFVSLTITSMVGGSGAAGDSLFLDQIVVGAVPAAVSVLAAGA